MGTDELLEKPVKVLGRAGVACNGLASFPGGVAINVVASCFRNRDKLWQLWAISKLPDSRQF